MMKKYSWCNADMGLMALRIGVAFVFIMAGWMKVSNIESTVSGFGSMGFAPVWAYVVSFGELIAGISILLGIYTRFFATFLAIVMLVATIKIHKDQTLVLHIFSLLALILGGGGKCSLIKKSCDCGTCNMCAQDNATPKAPSNQVSM